MYEYKYVKTSLGGLFTSPEHRGVFGEYASKGWKLVQV
ncbi:DUF4177 domain-containing protein [Bacillus sp. 2205SS5-2]